METELIVREEIDALEIYTIDGRVDPLLEEITRRAKEVPNDVSVKKNRDAIKSMAYRVAQSKTLLDNLGKDLVADWKEKAKKVDSSRKHIRDYLDALKDEVRQPLTEWEAEQARIKEEERLKEELEKDWDEAIQHNCLIDREREIARKEAELQRMEEERLAKEEAERIEQERVAREERIKKEAAEQAKREAEELIRKEREEAVRRELAAKQDAELAERQRKEALLKAEQEKQAAIAEERERARKEAERIENERLQREREEQERKERERLETERKLEEERKAAEAKARHHAHRKSINNAALTDFVQNGVDEETAKIVISLIAAGGISHITINY